MTPTSPVPFTSNIQKGGALLDDCRRVVEVWDREQTAEDNLARISDQNLLAKVSRARTDDVLRRIIGPRLVEPGPHLIPALKGLLHEPRAFREACYYETSRDDGLVAAFAEDLVAGLWLRGRMGIQITDVTSWLSGLEAQQRTPAWTDLVRTKVARGLLAALRDFGVLTGANTKDIAAPDMSPRGFAYVAWRLHEQGASSRALVSTAVWRRWLLDHGRVQDLFVQTSRLGVLNIATAGSAVRIDWRASSLAEVTGAAA